MNVTENSKGRAITGHFVAVFKDTGRVLCLDERLYVKSNENIWHEVSDTKAVIEIRTFFKKEKTVTHALATDMVKNLKTDPDIQIQPNVFQHPKLLKVNNGIWDIQNQCIIQNDNLKFDRKTDAYISEESVEESDVFNEFCRKIFTKENFEQKKKALYEIIGFCISDTESVKKAIFLIGPPNCGKSVILRFIQRLIGEDHVSNVSLSNFSGRFNIVSMYDKVLNINGEVPSSTLSGKALDVFKSITGGDKIELERKGYQPFSGIVRAKLLFAGNLLPMFSNADGTDSLTERLHVLIFDSSVEEAERDIHLEEKLWEQRDNIVYYALLALNNFIKCDKKFIVLEDEKQRLEAMKFAYKQIESFIDSYMDTGEDYYVSISSAYEAYLDFAYDELLEPMKRSEFRNKMLLQPGISISKTKKRFGNSNPQHCFKGIRFKKLYYKKQDTVLNDNKEDAKDVR